MINLSHLQKNYEPSLRLLLQDWQNVFAYVEPTDSNRGTFSQRIYEMYLRSCTEFESVCKDALFTSNPNYSKPRNDTKINDYSKIESDLSLAGAGVFLLDWQPSKTLFEPFTGWSTNSPRLSWYSDYNTVKHNRQAEFPKASIENAINATSALLILCHKTYILNFTNTPILQGTSPRHGRTEIINITPYNRYEICYA